MPCSTCLKFPSPTSNYDEVAVNEPMQSELYRCRACGQLIRTGALRGASYLSSANARQQFPGFNPSTS